ncbi:MAG: autotransporter-associated beta strand repeat-containing protein [Pirellulales bacterium]|nr:autotransporter-associated beta strand repeat-containing protein [Pirellulales bacterium]
MNFVLFRRKTRCGGGRFILVALLFTLPIGLPGSFFAENVQAANLTWVGDWTYNAWDINTSANWTGDSFYYNDGDNVTFDGLGAYPSIDLTTTLAPNSVTVNNGLYYDYIFYTNGAGKLSGPLAGGLTKSGDGTLTINTANDFDGVVNVNGGMLVVGNAAALGSTVGGTVVNGGALELNGFDLNEQLTVQGAGIDIDYDTIPDGALVNNVTNDDAWLYNLVLSGDTTFGGQYGIYIQNGVNFNHHDITVNHTGGISSYNYVNIQNVASHDLNNAAIAKGCLNFENSPMGDASGTITLSGADSILRFSNSTGSEVTRTKNIFSEGGVIHIRSGDHVIQGTLTFNSGETEMYVRLAANNLSFSDAVGGSGAMKKTGSGALIFLGNNTHNGTTTITTGNLQFGRTGQNTGAPGSGDFVLDGGNLRFYTDQAFSLSGTVSGATGTISYGLDDSVLLDGLAVTVTGDNTYEGATDIYKGTVILASATGLGSTAAGTRIYGGEAHNGRLNLTNNISIAEPITLYARENSVQNTPHIVNASGNNTLNTALTIHTGGTHVTLQSEADLLTVAGDITGTLGEKYLNLQGDGAGKVTGSILAYDTGNTLHVYKNGAGAWTLESAGNTYNGNTVITGGTLALGASAAISSSPIIDVQVDSFFDVTLQTSGLTLAGTQTLMGAGTVQGTILTSGGSSIVPGDSVGQLTVNGNLTLAGGDTLQYELSVNPAGGNDRIDINKLSGVGGNLTCNAGVTTVNVDMIEGSLGTGTYTLIDYEGALSGNAGNFTLTGVGSGNTRQTFSIKTANDLGGTPNQVNLIVSGAPLSLTWKGNGSVSDWDVVGTANWNNNTEKFYEADSVTFDDTGVAATVNITEDVTPNAMTVDNSAMDYTFAGVGGILGSTGLTKNGTHKLTIANSGGNAFSGVIAVNGGTLAYAHGADTAVANDFSGSGNLRQEGAGVLTLSGDNGGFSGTVTVAPGSTLRAGADGALGNASAVATVEDGATLDVNGKNLGDAQIVVQGSGTDGNGVIVSAAATQQSALKYLTFTGNATLGGTYTDATDTGRWDVRDGTVSATTPGTFTLTKKGTNTIAFADCTVTDKLGDIDIQAGTLSFDYASTMGDLTKTITIASGGTLAFYQPENDVTKPIVSNGGTIRSISGADNVLAGPVSLDGAADTTFSVSSGTLTVTSSLGNGGGSTAGIVKSGSGTLVLNAANTYAGNTSVAGGTLALDSSSGYAVPQNIVYTNSGTVRLEQGEEDGGQAQMPAAGTITFTDTAGSQYLNLNGHTLTLEGIDILNPTMASDDRVAIQNAGAAASVGLLVIDNSLNHVFRGEIRDNGGKLAVTKSGVGTLTILGANSGNYTGVLTVEEGTLSVDDGMGNMGMLPASGPVAVTGSTAILDIGWSSQTAGGFQITSGVLDGIGSLASATDCDVQGGTVNAVLTGAAGLVKTGAGTTATLTNVNTFTGATQVREGTLLLSGLGSVDSSSDIDVSGGAVLDVSGVTFNVGSYTTQTLRGGGMVAGTVHVKYIGTVAPGTYAAGQTLTVGNDLDLSSGGGSPGYSAKLECDLSPSAASGNDQVAVTGALYQPGLGTTADVVFHGLGAALDTGSNYTLVSYNSFDGTDVSRFNLIHDTRYTASSLVFVPDDPLHPELSGKIQLQVAGSPPLSLTWHGEFTQTWDTKFNTPWNADTEMFYEMDAVTFDNNGYSTTSDISVIPSGTVYPSSITVANDADHNYIFSGALGKISGPTGITKSGAGTLTIDNSGNDFTGVVTVNEGVLKIGSNSVTPFGAAGPDSDTVVNGGTPGSPGGTLELGGMDAGTEQITVQGVGVGGNGAVVNNTDATARIRNLVLSGDATLGGSQRLDIYGATCGNHTLTVNHSGNGAPGTWDGVRFISTTRLETDLMDAHIVQGTLAFHNASLGDPDGTITVDNGTTLQLYDSNAADTYLNDVTKNLAFTGGRLYDYRGQFTIHGAVTLDDLATEVYVQTTSNSTRVIFMDAITGDGGITKTGAGPLVLSGANTYEGDTTITAGVLELTDTSQIDVASLITNDAAFLVSGGTHTLGVIEGTGSMTVLDSAGVTAASITQGTLTIGGGGGGGAAAAAAPVPEPGAWTLLLIGLIGIAGWRSLRSRR